MTLNDGEKQIRGIRLMTPSLYWPLKRILFHFQFCGGGGSFSEVLSSSYELTLSEYGEDNEAASLLALGEPASHCPPSPHQHQAHGHPSFLTKSEKKWNPK